MTTNVDRAAPAAMDGIPSSSGDRAMALVSLATEWLRSEAASVREPAHVELVEAACAAAAAYEHALAGASPDDLALAREQAVVRQARNEVGSAEWTAALRVSELLRFEHEAARQARTR